MSTSVFRDKRLNKMGNKRIDGSENASEMWSIKVLPSARRTEIQGKMGRLIGVQGVGERK